ncbi:protein kinase domain-containing protein [Chryseobacterium sp. SL1]|uniref:protein kinase domain-containing protein n=1 Tax=Chryseobacterium sp. SL1 TaxID=2995159 RepID=UPI00227406D4|nr:protein kinase [Chryseobacterium sp. SL1]MCY1661152.1 protein kinase [Chryseobacterium sp. SL1]
MKYQLLNNYDLAVYQDEDSGSIAYLLNETKKQKQYKITKTIYSILSNLKTPLSKEECYKILFGDNCSPEYWELFSKLFSDLIENKIIVDFNKNKSKDFSVDIEKVERKIEQKFVLSDIIHESSKSRVRKIIQNDKIYILKIHKLSAKKGFPQIANEDTILRRIEKLNIAPIVSQYSSEFHYIIIGYLDAYIPIRAHIVKQEKSIEDKIKISLNILKAYVKLFNVGIFHNDIHLSNILVNESHDIKLLDFEHSFFRNDKSEKRTNVAVNQYIPPERIGASSFKKISSDNTLKSEVYQIGLIIYLIFKEKFPVFGNTWSELKESIQNFRMTKPKECYNDKTQINLYNFLNQAMNNNPNLRYKNILEMYINFKKFFYEKNS